MKISTGNHVSSVWKNQRIVRRTAAFDCQHAFNVLEHASDSTMNLRNAPDAVSVLHAWIFLAMRLANFTAVDQSAHVFCHCNLTRMWSRLLNALIKRPRRP